MKAYLGFKAYSLDPNTTSPSTLKHDALHLGFLIGFEILHVEEIPYILSQDNDVILLLIPSFHTLCHFTQRRGEIFSKTEKGN